MLSIEIENAIRDAMVEVAQRGDYRKYVGDYSQRLTVELGALLDGAECLLVSSGTAGLEIALRIAGIGVGDEIILSAYDYPGNFWAIERVGAKPLLLDTEADSWHISREQLESLANKQALHGCKALVASHLHGQLQDSAWLRHFCDLHGLLFVEDCCQALGATLDDQPVGIHGHVAILSFGGGKLISAGRGGALLTADRKLFQKARLAAGAGSGPYALSEVQAAIVLAQLAWLSTLVDRGRQFFAQLQLAICERRKQLSTPVIMPAAAQIDQAGFYQAGWLVGVDRSSGDSSISPNHQPEPAKMGSSSEISCLPELVNRLRVAGVPAGEGFAGFHRRSARRCRIAFNVAAAKSVAQRTLVVHHRVGIEENLAPEELADLLVSALREPV